MGFINALQIKQKRSKVGSPIYKNIGKTYGYYRRSNYQGYESIVREIYFSNFVINRALEEKIKAMRKIDFCVYQRTQDKDKIIVNHPVSVMLKEPNDLYGGNELKKRMTLFYEFVGEVPFQIIKNTFRNRIYTYRPDRIYYTPTGDEFAPYRDVQYTGSVNASINIEDFMMLKNFNPADDIDGLGRGISPLIATFKQVDLFNSISEWKLSLTENGGNLSGVISVDDVLDDNIYDRAKAEIKQQHTGPKNIGKYLFLEGGAKFMATSNTPKDMDYIEGEKQIVTNLCAGVGVDPLIIGFKEFSTYNNLQEASKDLYNKGVIPFMEMFADFFTTEFTKKALLKENEYVGLDTSKVLELQKDKKNIVERLKSSDFMTVNEKRAELGLDSKKGGDVILVPINLIPLESSLQQSDDTEEKSLFSYADERSWY